MKSKKWDRCRFFECPHPTWSGRIERDLKDRVCLWHMPENIAQQNQNFAGRIEKKIRQAPKPRKNNFFLPLVCVYKKHIVVEKAGIRRVVFTAKVICGNNVPRRSKGDRSLPISFNRFGEPLCREHLQYANDLDVFPDEEGVTPINAVSVESSVREERLRYGYLASIERAKAAKLSGG